MRRSADHLFIPGAFVVGAVFLAALTYYYLYDVDWNDVVNSESQEAQNDNEDKWAPEGVCTELQGQFEKYQKELSDGPPEHLKGSLHEKHWKQTMKNLLRGIAYEMREEGCLK